MYYLLLWSILGFVAFMLGPVLRQPFLTLWIIMCGPVVWVGVLAILTHAGHDHE